MSVIHKLTLAAEQGNSFAQWQLGSRHRDGDGVPQDGVLSYMWFSVARKFGQKLALYQLNDLYAHHLTPEQVCKGARLALDWLDQYSRRRIEEEHEHW